ncbi:DUF2203 domain-containing protein [Brevibacillus fulvus]|uniref:Cell division protein DivIVA n=1 Tax=Brevibacillus fulvus TaxID=1125967 RepID=A0A939BT23_9BACL|nr:DUF2203 domain-containing protein [Brevibacillus fulvus]MBM7589054.1 hypothetical protein [Brevibacillus fulvus]
MVKKYFTVEEANELLPYVKSELTFLQKTKAEFYQKYHELQALKKQTSGQSAAEIESAVFALECSLEFLELELRLHIERIQEKGIQLKDIDLGLFDFPAFVDGREVLLCWKQGEPAVLHYHGLDEGFLGRKSL